MKKKTISLLAAFLVGAGLQVSAQVTDTPSGYHLVWGDDFNGTSLNEKIWNVEVNGNGGGNQELQYYRKENVAVADGNLVLTAKRENYQGKSFTSGRVTSKGKAAFKHGILQARIKFPKTANGLWPAYWMMGNDMDRHGWPKCGEMDIIELGHANGIAAGTQDRYFAGTLHFGPDASNENHQQVSQDITVSADNPVENDGYHVFTVIWDENNLEMFYDLASYKAAQKRKAKYFTLGIPSSDGEVGAGHYFHKPFFFLFNLAVGGSYPSIYNASQITALPNAGDEAKMYVDWVRVYQADNDTTSQYTYVDDNGNTVTNIPAEPEPTHETDSTTVLSGFATKALDDNGVSTFDFNDVSDAVLVSTSDGVTGHLKSAGANVTDYNVDNTKNFLYIWENTYVADGTTDKTNSFGWEEGYNRFAVTNVGWSGLGFASSSGNGKDLSRIDDSYWLHFAMKADDKTQHTSHSIYVGDAQFRIGKSDGKLASLGDFPRDGQWYYFDIPVKALHQFAGNLFGTTATNYEGNVVAFLSGGVSGAELDFDNIFFYKSKTKTVPNYVDNDSTGLGKYGYKSLDANGKAVFDFDKAKNVTPIILSSDMWEHVTAGGTYENSIVAKENDLTEQAAKNNFFVWENTMNVTHVTDVANSFGNVPYGGFNAYTAASGATWTGSGWASISGQGNTVTAKDLSKIDESYWVHFSLRSDAAVGDAPISIKFGASTGDAQLTFGRYSTNPLFAEFPRNGQWYSFDIPLSVVKQYGKLWSNAPSNGGLSAYTDYVLTFSFGGTLYTGSPVSIDNVFFYQPTDKKADDVTSAYTTKSLEAKGNSTFDFSGKQFIPVTAGAKERLAMGTDNIVSDFAINDANTHLYIWEGTYTDGTCEGVNSFGNDEKWTSVIVANKGWSGLGIINDDGYDCSAIDDSTYLHFALKATSSAYDYHFTLGKAHFTIGAAGYTNGNGELFPALSDFPRNGEWYSFDIPMSVISNLSSDIWNGQQSAFKDNLFCIDTESAAGNALQIDNVFFWRNKKVATAIDNTFADTTTPTRVIAIYNMQGQRVPNTHQPGLYIVRTTKGVRKIFVK